MRNARLILGSAMLGLGFFFLIPNSQFLISARASSVVEVLRPTGALPVRLVEDIESPRAFVETSTGEALVLDASAQAVYAIDAARTRVRRIISVGVEAGHIIRPNGVSMGPDDLLAIADSPGTYSRLQNFDSTGRLIGWFYLAEQPGARVALGGLSLQGPGAVASTGRTFLFNAPRTGSLINEFDARGDAVRAIGMLRSTGQEADPAVHVALNRGLPLVDPTGGFYFVFETGVPIFRKYDAQGVLRFERHVEGVEIDAALAQIPTRWMSRPDDGGSHPFAPGLVQTAAVDPQGRLWIALSTGYTYVYDERGDKTRTIQFQSKGLISPVSLFFARGHRLLVTPGCYEFPTD
jgi:hypothetical protein